jgi:hypothetical protein
MASGGLGPDGAGQVPGLATDMCALTKRPAGLPGDRYLLALAAAHSGGTLYGGPVGCPTR